MVWNHGHYPTDDGVLLAAGWRIFHGQVPYRDFLYAFPPLSPYLHSLWFWLPSGAVFSAARLAHILGLAAAAGVWAWWGYQKGGLRPNGVTLFLVGAFFYFSIHDSPSMPWYTVDAILLSSLGGALMLVSCDRKVRSLWLTRLLSGLCFSLAVLAKQSFLGMYVLWLALSLIDLKLARRWIFLVGTVAVSLLPFLVAGAWLSHQNGLEPFLRQITVLSTGNAVETFGWDSFWRSFDLHRPYFFFGLALGKAPRRWRGTIGLLLVLSLFFWVGGIANPWWGFQLFWLGLGLTVFLIGERREERLWIFFSLFAVSLAWSSAVSHGWNTPLLGIAPLGVLLARFIDKSVEASVARRRETALAGLLLFGSAFYVMEFQGLRYFKDRPRAEQRYDLARVYPRFGSLYTNATTFERYADLHALSERLDALGSGVMVVHPEFPLFYYLENRLNPMPVDWWFPMGYRAFGAALPRRFSAAKPTVLLEVEPGEGCEPVQKDEVASWVIRHGRLEARSKRFCAFELRG